MASPIVTYLDPNNNVAFQVDSAGNASAKGNLTVPGNLTVTGNITSNANTGLTQQVAKVTLSSAQLLALKTTPISLLAAPGAGKAIDVISITLRYVFGTTAYTLNAGTFKIFYGTTANAHALVADQSALLTNTATKTIVGLPTLVVAADSDANSLNNAIFAGNDGGANYTLGDGTVNVTLVYSIVTP